MGGTVDLMAALEDSLAKAKNASIHAYYKKQGFDSCPRCGEWIAEQMGRPVPAESEQPDDVEIFLPQPSGGDDRASD